MLNIYLLKLIHDQPQYTDVARGFVVIASSGGMARLLAAKQAGDEGSEAWYNPDESSCELIGIPGAGFIYPAGQTAHVVLRDFYGV